MVISQLIVFIILLSVNSYSQKLPKYYTIGIMKELFNDVNINDAGAACNIWLNEIRKLNKSNYDLDLKIYENYNEVHEDLIKGNLAFLALNVVDFMQLKDKFSLDPQFIASFKGDTEFRYLLLTSKDKNYKDIKDLKDLRIGITSKYNNDIPKLWFDVFCAKNNISDIKSYFKEIITTPNESQLILNLFFGKIDACLVPEKIFRIMAELNPQMEARLTPLASSPYYIFTIMCFTKNYINEEDRKVFTDNALKMHELVSGKQIMMMMKINKLVLFHDTDLDSYRQLLEDYKKISGSKKGLKKQNLQTFSNNK